MPQTRNLVEVQPPGMIAFFANSSVPNGWLVCNGAAVSRTTYSDLFAAIGTLYGAGDGSTTFNLPDLRGEFIRGWDNGRGVDTGRKIGTAQSDQMQSHRHSMTAYGYGNSSNWGSGGGVVSGTVTTAPPSADGWNGTPRVGAETRPRNVAMLACIKY